MATLPATMAEVAKDALSDGRIDAAGVQRIRRHLYKDGSVSTEEAELLLHLYGAAAERDAEFDRLFVEALDDYFLVGDGLRLEVRADAVARLQPLFGPDGGIPDRTLFDLVLRLIDRGANSPKALFDSALKALEDHVLRDDRTVFDTRAGEETIDESDVALIRKVVYGPGGETGMFIARREAELLFALHRATADKNNCDAWNELFVKGVTAYLLQAGDTPGHLDSKEAEWLANHLPGDDLHENERALLAYVKKIATSLHPAGEAFLGRHGV